jgi:nucleoside-diphosphate kinase
MEEPMIERTLSIIKPDGVKKKVIGDIIKRFEESGLRIAAMKMIYMDKRQAQGFYLVHKDKPFYDSLTDFMSSWPCVVMILEGENAISKNRELMGATDFKKAAPGTIRATYASSIEVNTVHGSDAPETAATETAYFFSDIEKFSL